MNVLLAVKLKQFQTYKNETTFEMIIMFKLRQFFINTINI